MGIRCWGRRQRNCLRGESVKDKRQPYGSSLGYQLPFATVHLLEGGTPDHWPPTVNIPTGRVSVIIARAGMSRVQVTSGLWPRRIHVRRAEAGRKQRMDDAAEHARRPLFSIPCNATKCVVVAMRRGRACAAAQRRRRGPEPPRQGRHRGPPATQLTPAPRKLRLLLSPLSEP